MGARMGLGAGLILGYFPALRAWRLGIEGEHGLVRVPEIREAELENTMEHIGAPHETGAFCYLGSSTCADSCATHSATAI